MAILKKKIYTNDTVQVARFLLGKNLVREIRGIRLSGMITETEAYCGKGDSACHAHRDRTPRNSIMFGHPGHAYVYFTYGMHYMLNLVTEEEGNPCAVLIRAVQPLAGIAQMESRRKKKGTQLTNGPAKLCQAFAIDKSLNGWDLTCGKELWLEDYKTFPPLMITATPRIGIDYARQEHRDALWRFILKKEGAK